MGCSSSKIARKRAADDDCFAPVSRSVSAPIHHPAESEGDSCHVVSLTSSSYGILNMYRPGYQTEGGSFLKLAKGNQHLNDNAKNLATNAKFNFVSEEDGRKLAEDDADLEVINTWELMEGLEDGGEQAMTPLKARGARKRICPERARSFSAVQGLKYVNTELSSPVWRKYFAQEMEKEKRPDFQGESPITPPPMSPLKIRSQPTKLIMDGDGISMSSMEPLDGNSSLKMILTPSKTSSGLTSSLRKDAAELETCVSSDDVEECLSHDAAQELEISGKVASPDMRSDSKDELVEPSSPVFDPALVATFEQALEAITGAEDEWLLVHADGSTTHSSTPSENNTWISSETTSDAESPHEQVRNKRGVCSVQVYRERTIPSSKVTPVDDKEEQLLENFELRCPPRGQDKVVLYFTSLRGIRKTYEDCCDLKLILQGFGVKVDERDVWMHSRYKDELKQVMEDKKLSVPRLFIKGRHIGGADEVKQLHEEGILGRLVQGLPTELCRTVCDGCGDLRFIPCVACSGSCKVLDEHDQVARCLECNENGLIMCPICN